MLRPGIWEEECVMNEELRGAFDEIKSDLKEAHRDVTEHISDFGKALNKHMLEDAIVAERFKNHCEEEEKARKWRIALFIGAWGAFVTAIAELAFKFLIKG